jgi:uncharacterized protein (TIGR02118 family)
MIKMVALVNKKRDLNNKDFVRYWLDIHAPLEKKWPGLKRYVISTTVGVFGGSDKPEYDGVAELWFNDEDALKVALASEERAISREDFLKFVDNAKIMITKEYVIHDEINK